MTIPKIEARYYVAEIVNGERQKVTCLFAYKADAEAARGRMREGIYVVCDVKAKPQNFAELFATILMDVAQCL